MITNAFGKYRSLREFAHMCARIQKNTPDAIFYPGISHSCIADLSEYLENAEVAPGKLGRANPRGTRFLFSLFVCESSCHVSTAQKSEIFIIPTFPAGRTVGPPPTLPAAPCPVRVKFRPVKGILNSFYRSYARDRRNPVLLLPYLFRTFDTFVLGTDRRSRFPTLL